jgi:hypothetical protein
MDVLEELDISLVLASGTFINPEIADVEFKPSLLIINNRFLKGSGQFNVIISIPHIFGRPWTPKNTCLCVKLNAKRNGKIWCYNGFVYAFHEYSVNIPSIGLIMFREKGICKGRESNGAIFTNNDPNNLFIDRASDQLYTKLGNFTILKDGTLLGHKRCKKYQYVRNMYLDEDIYNMDGTLVESPYTGVLVGGIPVGCGKKESIYTDYTEIVYFITMNKDSKCTSTVEIMEGLPPINDIEIPILRNMKDILDYALNI